MARASPVTFSGLGTAEHPRERLARILETPHLARLVPQLPPASLHHVIQHCGLEDCESSWRWRHQEQLAAVFDLDLWRSAQPGMEEQFDAARFAVWLEVLAESSAAFAAQNSLKWTRRWRSLRSRGTWRCSIQSSSTTPTWPFQPS
jgi:hypothetical protein